MQISLDTSAQNK